MNTTTIDCTGLNCPLPVLRLKKAIDGINAGETLEMIATDPGSVKDIAAWSKQTGHMLLESRESAGRFTFVIQKAH
ncbi:MAG: sulfurtransferase TusA family protein [Acidiferrobacteraceae bacterium]